MLILFKYKFVTSVHKKKQSHVETNRIDATDVFSSLHKKQKYDNMKCKK